MSSQPHLRSQNVQHICYFGFELTTTAKPNSARVPEHKPHECQQESARSGSIRYVLHWDETVPCSSNTKHQTTRGIGTAYGHKFCSTGMLGVLPYHCIERHTLRLVQEADTSIHIRLAQTYVSSLCKTSAKLSLLRCVNSFTTV